MGISPAADKTRNGVRVVVMWMCEHRKDGGVFSYC
jgi:hypothetical protein